MRLTISTRDRCEIGRLVDCLFHGNRAVVKVTTIHFEGKVDSFTVKGDSIMLTVKDTDVPGSGTYKFSFLDAKGRKAKVDGLPTIAAADPTIVDSIGPVVDNGDGSFSAPFHVLDNVGTSQVTINADVDLGSGTNNKDFVDVVNVIAGDAASITGDFGTVTPDTPPAA